MQATGLIRSYTHGRKGRRIKLYNVCSVNARGKGKRYNKSLTFSRSLKRGEKHLFRQDLKKELNE